MNSAAWFGEIWFSRRYWMMMIAYWFSDLLCQRELTRAEAAHCSAIFWLCFSQRRDKMKEENNSESIECRLAWWRCVQMIWYMTCDYDLRLRSGVFPVEDKNVGLIIDNRVRLIKTLCQNNKHDVVSDPPIAVRAIRHMRAPEESQYWCNQQSDAFMLPTLTVII